MSMTDLPFTLDQLRLLKAITKQRSFKKANNRLIGPRAAVSVYHENVHSPINVSLYEKTKEQNNFN